MSNPFSEPVWGLPGDKGFCYACIKHERVIEFFLDGKAVYKLCESCLRKALKLIEEEK